jgi:hypothetical protein
MRCWRCCGRDRCNRRCCCWLWGLSYYRWRGGLVASCLSHGHHLLQVERQMTIKTSHYTWEKPSSCQFLVGGSVLGEARERCAWCWNQIAICFWVFSSLISFMHAAVLCAACAAKVRPHAVFKNIVILVRPALAAWHHLPVFTSTRTSAP